MAWGEAKQRLFGLIDAQLAPMRQRYEEWMARPEEINDVLQIGARKARCVASPLIVRLRAAVGLR